VKDNFRSISLVASAQCTFTVRVIKLDRTVFRSITISIWVLESIRLRSNRPDVTLMLATLSMSFFSIAYTLYDVRWGLRPGGPFLWALPVPVSHSHTLKHKVDFCYAGYRFVYLEVEIFWERPLSHPLSYVLQSSNLGHPLRDGPVAAAEMAILFPI
jgi:hypothetical protein